MVHRAPEASRGAERGARHVEMTRSYGACWSETEEKHDDETIDDEVAFVASDDFGHACFYTAPV